MTARYQSHQDPRRAFSLERCVWHVTHACHVKQAPTVIIKESSDENKQQRASEVVPCHSGKIRSDLARYGTGTVEFNQDMGRYTSPDSLDSPWLGEGRGEG